MRLWEAASVGRWSGVGVEPADGHSTYCMVGAADATVLLPELHRLPTFRSGTAARLVPLGSEGLVVCAPRTLFVCWLRLL